MVPGNDSIMDQKAPPEYPTMELQLPPPETLEHWNPVTLRSTSNHPNLLIRRSHQKSMVET